MIHFIRWALDENIDTIVHLFAILYVKQQVILC